MTIEDFLQILQDRDLVPEAIVKQVRAKVEKGDRRITPKSLLKYLVKKEYVTRRQAKQLLETTLTVTPNAESSILGMVPIPKAPKQETPPREEIPTITPVEDEGSGSLVTDEGTTAPAGGADLFGDRPSSLLSQSLSKIGLGSDATLTEAIQEGNLDDDSTRKRKKKKAKKNEWDSSLLLLGGGGLILLVITGVIIGYLLNREDADAVLAEAGEYFDGGSYTQAIKQYERFVENHTKHPEYSAGKVKLGLARLWKATSSSTNFVPALTTAQEVLQEIEAEKEFSIAHRDLASLLPKIAQGLANQAEKATDPEKVQDYVKQANAAISLCANTKYIQSAYRDEVRMSEITQTLERVERSRAQNAALNQALTDMQAAIDSGETAKAYQIHDQLLEEHAGLINNEELAAKVLEISTAESAVVKYVEESQAALTEPRPSSIVAALALANRDGPTVQAKGTIAVRVDGAVYGVNLADGAVIWRRYVGAAARLFPQQLPSGDLLVVDSRHHELQKLNGNSGKLVWRHPFETSIERPVLLKDRILIAESAGKLHVLDANSGERQGYVQFAQKLSAPPAVGAQGRRVYITGEHSSLYTLSTDDFSCVGVFFLNHGKGSVTTPPISVLNKVLVAVAKGVSTSRLEVLNTTADGIPNQRATNRRLTGLVNTALLSQGRRVVAVTSRGQIAVYEVGAGTGDEALTKIATRDPETGLQVARFGALLKGQLWVAGPKLNKLTILPTSDRLPVSNIDQDYRGDVFDHPLQVRGDLLIHVRRPAEQAGAIVGAVKMKSGQSQWETALAAPPAGPPAVDTTGFRLSTISATGAAYLVDRESMKRRVLNSAQQVRSSSQLPPLNQSLDLGQGRILAAATNTDVLLHYRPDLPRKALKTVQLVGPTSCDLVRWDNGFVVPTQTGQVYHYLSETADQWGSPFQPPLQPGATYNWLPPAVYGSGAESQLVLTDGNKKVYLLSRVSSPQPHLTADSVTDVSTSPLNTRFAVVGDMAIAGAEDGSLAVFELPALSPKPSVDVGAQVVWGPYAVGQNVLLATATEELVCLDDRADIAWRQSLTHGPPAGQPLATEAGLLVLWQQGGLSRLQLANGEEAAYVPLPQPAVAGPKSFGKRFVVSMYDGTLLIVDQP